MHTDILYSRIGRWQYHLPVSVSDLMSEFAAQHKILVAKVLNIFAFSTRFLILPLCGSVAFKCPVDWVVKHHHRLIYNGLTISHSDTASIIIMLEKRIPILAPF